MLFDHCALSWGLNHWIQRLDWGYRALYQGVFPFVSNSLDLGISATTERGILQVGSATRAPFDVIRPLGHAGACHSAVGALR